MNIFLRTRYGGLEKLRLWSKGLSVGMLHHFIAVFGDLKGQWRAVMRSCEGWMSYILNG